MTKADYAKLAIDYARLRRPDPRIAARINAALADARSVVNIGAGAGSYEPDDCDVTAVEPSADMIAKRAQDAAPAVQASAEALPFPDKTFDAAMAVNTVHHWTDKAKGMAEMRRVARDKVVIFTTDPDFPGMWLNHYLPELAALDHGQMPPLRTYHDWFDTVEITPILVPKDCVDGFLYAYWQRPAAYLDPRITGVLSSFQMIGGGADGLEALRHELESGEWERRFGEVMNENSLDVGYRLVIGQLT